MTNEVRFFEHKKDSDDIFGNELICQINTDNRIPNIGETVYLNEDCCYYKVIDVATDYNFVKALSGMDEFNHELDTVPVCFFDVTVERVDY